MRSIRKLFLIPLALILPVALLTGGPVPPAHAAATGSLSVYFDAPFVQGSYVASNQNSGAVWTNFEDALGVGQCGVGQPAGVTISGDCRVDAAAGHGGSSLAADVSTPHVGGVGSRFATTYGSNVITINLADDSRYLGLWWSAGSTGNTVTFYRDSTSLLTVSTDNVMTLLGSAPADAAAWVSKNTDDSANVVTSVGTGADQQKHRKVWYFGHPKGYLSTSPTAESTITRNEPFLYLHLFAGGDLSFNKVVLSGPNFEFDNLVVSATSQVVNSRLVKVSETVVTGWDPFVRFLPNGEDVTGTMEPQVSESPQPLTEKSFSRPGYRFTGWNTEPDGSGAAYSDRENYSFAASLTLYAQWESTADSSSDLTESSGSGTDTSTDGLAGLELARTGGTLSWLAGVAGPLGVLGSALLGFSLWWSIRRT